MLPCVPHSGSPHDTASICLVLNVFQLMDGQLVMLGLIIHVTDCHMMIIHFAQKVYGKCWVILTVHLWRCRVSYDWSNITTIWLHWNYLIHRVQLLYTNVLNAGNFAITYTILNKSGFSNQNKIEGMVNNHLSNCNL